MSQPAARTTSGAGTRSPVPRATADGRTSRAPPAAAAASTTSCGGRGAKRPRTTLATTATAVSHLSSEDEEEERAPELDYPLDRRVRSEFDPADSRPMLTAEGHAQAKAKAAREAWLRANQPMPAAAASSVSSQMPWLPASAPQAAPTIPSAASSSSATLVHRHTPTWTHVSLTRNRRVFHCCDQPFRDELPPDDWASSPPPLERACGGAASMEPASSASAVRPRPHRRKRKQSSAAAAAAVDLTSDQLSCDDDDDECQLMPPTKRERAPSATAAVSQPQLHAIKGERVDQPAAAGASSSATQLECPVCFVPQPLALLEAHVDSCLTRSSGPILKKERRYVNLEAKPVKREGQNVPVNAGSPAAAAASSSFPAVASCMLCYEPIEASSLEVHLVACAERLQRKRDQVCGGVSVANLEAHLEECTGVHAQCQHCFHFRLSFQLPAHSAVCLQQQEELDQRGMAAILFQRADFCARLLTRQQVDAMKRIEELAKKRSVEAEPALLDRFRALGYGEQHLRFMRHEAPMNIHLNMDRAGAKLLADTHYRNCHEIGGRIHKARCDIESQLFGNYPGTPAFDRVKYGCLNYSLDPNGVKSAVSSYGDSYLLLRNETVRGRVTITSADSATLSSEIGTFDWFCHILVKFADPELRDLVRVVIGEKRHTNNYLHQWYREIQIHGPVRLDKDVAAICVASRHAKNKQLMAPLNQFGQLNEDTAIVMLEEGPPSPKLKQNA